MEVKFPSSFIQTTGLNSSDSSMTPEDYRLKFWSELRDAIDQMLSHPPGSYKPISYEQMYSAVYKCVCKQYSEQLYADLITHIRTRLVQMSNILNDVSDNQFISEFHKALVQYFHALGGIVPIFTYMNRFYIEAKLHTDLKTELTKLFSCLVADKHVKRLVNLMVMVQSIPFSVPPDIMATLCRHLYTLNPDYANIHPGLFSSYLPNVGPRMTEEDLQAQMAQDRALQESLRAQGWGCPQNTLMEPRKRNLEEEPTQKRLPENFY